MTPFALFFPLFEFFGLLSQPFGKGGARHEFEGVGLQIRTLERVVPLFESVGQAQRVLAQEGGVGQPVGEGVEGEVAIFDKGIFGLEVESSEGGNVGRWSGEEGGELLRHIALRLEEVARLASLLEGRDHDIVGREVGEGDDADRVVAHGVYPQRVVACVGKGRWDELFVEKTDGFTRL